MTPAASPTPTTSPPTPAADAPVYLEPPTISVSAGQTFSLVIRTNATASQPIIGVQAVVTFDPAKLEVVDADAGTLGIQVLPGTGLPVVLLNSTSNGEGKIEYAAGKLGAPFPAGDFIVATIQFRARAATSGATPVAFYFSSGFGTEVVYDNAIPGKHADAAVTIAP